MRLTIPHNKTRPEVVDAVNRGVDQMFTGVAGGPVEFVDQQKSWSGSVLTFSLTAKMGFLKTPIAGTILVGDKDLTIDVDLGLLTKLIPEQTAKNQLEARVRGLLT